MAFSCWGFFLMMNGQSIEIFFIAFLRTWSNDRSRFCFLYPLLNWEMYHLIHDVEFKDNLLTFNNRLLMWRGSFSGIRKLHDSLNSNSLSSSETGVHPRIWSWKKHLFHRTRCQKAIGGIHFTKKWRDETLQSCSKFDNFKPRLKSGIFKCISWAEKFVLRGWWLEFFWKWGLRPI